MKPIRPQNPTTLVVGVRQKQKPKLCMLCDEMLEMRFWRNKKIKYCSLCSKTIQYFNRRMHTMKREIIQEIKLTQHLK